mmetsp:Transcript_48875/g.153524  ORF Transcript_48875/g.153524 Transcript_48875/m.153524 type:complete len:87 (+) Transcript_48875:1045-1305(+)
MRKTSSTKADAAGERMSVRLFDRETCRAFIKAIIWLFVCAPFQSTYVKYLVGQVVGLFSSTARGREQTFPATLLGFQCLQWVELIR